MTGLAHQNNPFAVAFSKTPQESFRHCSGSRTKTGLVLEVFKSKGYVDMPNLSVFYGVQLLKRVA